MRNDYHCPECGHPAKDAAFKRNAHVPTKRESLDAVLRHVADEVLTCGKCRHKFTWFAAKKRIPINKGWHINKGTKKWKT